MNTSTLDNINFKFKNTYYLVNLCVLLAFVGIGIKTFFSSMKIGNEQGPAFATFVGYIFSTIALIGILMGVASYYFKVKDNPKCFRLYPSLIQIIGLIILLTIIIYQNGNFSEKINNFKVSPEFYKFSNYSSLLIFVQLILIFTFLQNNMGCLNNSTSVLSTQSLGTLYISLILFVINFVCVGIMEVILRLYSTCF